MSLTVAQLKTNFNTYFGDDTTDRISDEERNQFLTEATSWLLEELENDHMVNTYQLQYYDTVYDYKVTNTLADLLNGADLRRDTNKHYVAFSRKSPREIAEEIGQENNESVWGIERKDGDAFLKINHVTDFRANQISSFDSLTDGGGEWQIDETNSDATNLQEDVNEFKEGNGSLKFDIDVSQSGNNKATLYNADTGTKDLTSSEDLSAFIFWVYIPDVTNFTSLTFYWGSDQSATPATVSNYWSFTTTTDIDGEPFRDGWNRIKIDWKDAIVTGNPDVTEVRYYQFDFDYDVAQADDTNFRVDDLKLARPEILTFHYVSWNVGKDVGGNDITAFTSDSDVPFFSGQYDQYKYAVAHKAASLAFYSVRLREDGQFEERDAIQALNRYRNIFESSVTREVRNFKVQGVNLRGRRRGNYKRLIF